MELKGLRGKSCSADDRCYDCCDWTVELWEKVRVYCGKLAIQREKKERKA